ncbi:MAG: hypothetical protein DMG80_16735 [Acidobacteria bacterium]|nr:MAG: hypothetical protein DMG80_16735 [Acidobacteriota bacterium]
MFVVHLVLVVIVCLRDTFYLLGQGYTLAPRALDPVWQWSENLAAATLGEGFDIANPLRQTVALYTHAAGIHSGYSFFAPNVPSSYKVVFEFHAPDGSVEYDLPEIASEATGLRLGNLLDFIGKTHYAGLREAMLRRLAYASARQHPRATSVRTVFGIVRMPNAEEYWEGERESYDVLYAYDFQLAPP